MITQNQLGMPPPTSAERNADKAVMETEEYLGKYPEVSQVVMNLMRFFRDHVDELFPMLSKTSKAAAFQLLDSFQLVIQQGAGKNSTRSGFLRMKLLPTKTFMPCTDTPGFNVYKLKRRSKKKDPNEEHEEILALSMEYDLSKGLREQVGAFFSEAVALMELFCPSYIPPE